MRQLLARFSPTAVGVAIAVIAALSSGWAAEPALAATPVCTWIAGSGDWNTATNWSCANTADTVPTASDDVILNDFTNPDITSGDASARSISVSAAGTLNIESGRTLTISSSGTTSFAGHVNVNGTGVLTLGDPTTFPSGGVVTDGGTINVNSSLSIPTAMTVGGGGVVKVGANGSIDSDPGSAKLVTFVPELDNDGTCPGCGVTVTSGTLDLQNGDAGSTAGSYSISSGATLQVDKGTLEAPSVTGLGTVDVAGSSHLTVRSTDTFTPASFTVGGGGEPEATLNKDISVGAFTTAGFADRDGTGNLTVTGSADLEGIVKLSGGTTTIAGSVTSSTIGSGLTVDGTTLTLDAPTVRTTNGPLTLGGNPSTLNINSSYDVTGANASVTGNSSSVVNIGPSGSMTVDPGATHETDIEVPLNNEGTVTTKTGKLALFDGSTGTNSGGYVIDAAGTVELEGSGSFDSSSITGAGTFIDFGPAMTVGSTDTFSPANLQLANGGTLTLSGSHSIVNLLSSGGGTRDGTGTLTITGSAALDIGTFTLNGGTTTIAGSASPVTIKDGSLVLSNATLNLDTPTTWAPNSGMSLSNSALNVNSSLTVTNDFGSIGGGADSAVNVGANGSIDVDPGAGTEPIVSVPIDTAGTVTVSSGTLEANGGLTQSAGTTTIAAGAKLLGAVTLNGGQLKGGGTLGGPVSNPGGTVAPGSSPGTLTDNGDYTQGSGGTLAEEITGTTPGTQFDQLLVDGALSLDGTLAIDSTSFTPASNDTFKIVSGAASRTGSFTSLTGATVNGATYSAQYDADGVTLLASGPPPPPQQTLAVAFAGTDAGSVSDGASLSCTASCQHQYPQGTVVHLSATPAAGSSFTGWAGGGCSGTGVCTVTMSADESVTATFTTIPPVPPVTHVLTVSKSGTGSGGVTSSPGGIDCGSTCSDTFNAGTQVTLTATADPGSTFAGWSGGGCSGTGTCTVTLNGDTTVTAGFTANQPPAPKTYCVVPRLLGKKLGAAKIALRKAHCRVGKVTHVKSTRKHRNRVISQHPQAGTHLRKGARVAFTIGT